MAAAPTELGGTETESPRYRTLLFGAMACGPWALPRWPPSPSTALRPMQYIRASPAVCVGQTGRATRQREMEIAVGTEMEMEWRRQDPHGGTDVWEPGGFLNPEPSFVLDAGHSIRVYACGWRWLCVTSNLHDRGMMPPGNFEGYIVASGCES